MKFYHQIFGLLASSCVAFPALADSANWSGPYVGTYVDVSYDELGVEDFGCWSACTKPTVQGTAIKAGVNVGYDLQIGETLVVGLVADIGSGSRRDLVEGAAIGSMGPGTFTFVSDLEFESSLRARVGLVQGDTLAYLTGGVAFAKGNFTVEGRDIPTYWANHSANFDADWSGSVTGQVFGGGIEHRFGPVSARFEVLHKRYAPVSTCFANTDAPDPGICWQDNYSVPPQVNYTFSATSMRVGINYRF